MSYILAKVCLNKGTSKQQSAIVVFTRRYPGCNVENFGVRYCNQLCSPQIVYNCKILRLGSTAQLLPPSGNSSSLPSSGKLWENSDATVSLLAFSSII